MYPRMGRRKLKEVEGMYEIEGGWAFKCKACNKECSFTKKCARNQCIGTIRIYDRLCRGCRPLRTPIAEYELTPEKDYSLQINSGDSAITQNTKLGVNILRFKSRKVECSKCGSKRMMNVPAEMENVHFFCHKCRSYELAMV